MKLWRLTRSAFVALDGEGSVIDAAHVPPLVTRAFSFSQCLHRPPMLDHYRSAE